MKSTWKNVYIEAAAYLLPEQVWSSEYLEKELKELYDRLHFSEGRLEFMTGISERRLWNAGDLPSEKAILCGKKLFHEAQATSTAIDTDQIDLLIYGSVCRDYLEPATAARVHHALNLSADCAFMDLSNACLGIVQAWMIASDLIESGRIRKAMVVGAENSGPLIDQTLKALKQGVQGGIDRKSIKPYLANLTIGSGAYACVLSHRDYLQTATPHCRLLGGVYGADSAGHDLCVGGGDTHSLSMQTDSEAMLERGLHLAQQTWQKLQSIQLFGKKEESADFGLTVTHQVGETHSRKLYESLNMKRDKDFSTFRTLGNVGPVSLPLTLAMALEKQPVQPDEKILLMGIGSGLNCLMMGAQR